MNSFSSSQNNNDSSIINEEPFIPEGYRLKWADEFQGSSLSNSWELMIGDGSNYGVYRWGNNEEQYYKEENAFVSGDNLHIVAMKDRIVTDEYTFNISSARLRTRGKAYFTYGYFVSRIKLPAGTGLWPAFWMLPERNYQGHYWPDSGEIDIMEARGRLVNQYGATIHTGNASHQDIIKNKEYNFVNSDITSYHDYGVLWDESGFKFYIDGEMFFEVTSSTYQNNNPLYSDNSANAPFDQPFHLLLNLAVGGNYDSGRTVDSSFEEAEMLVDYVRVYQK